MMDYIECSTYLLLYSKSPYILEAQNSNMYLLMCSGFCGSGMQEGLSWAGCFWGSGLGSLLVQLEDGCG